MISGGNEFQTVTSCLQEVEAPRHKIETTNLCKPTHTFCLYASDPRTPAKNHHEAIMQHRNTFESHVSLIGGRIRAPRCQALSKRSKVQCKKASLNSKRVCMFHGGKSTGPVTEDGRKRCALCMDMKQEKLVNIGLKNLGS